MANAAETRKRGGKTREPSVDKQQLLKAYRDMLLIRRFEEKAGQLYGMGLIGGFCHLYIGQEAVVVGMQMALSRRRRGHHVVPRPRSHAGDRHGAARRDGGTDRPRRRLFARQGRLDAHVQQGEELLRRPRHRRRAGQPRHRAGVQQLVSRQRPRRRHLFRRGRVEPGPDVRKLQPRRADEAAGDLRDREQQIRHGHQRRARVGLARPVEERRALGHSRRADRRHGRGGGEGGGRAGGGALPGRQGAVPDRGEDLSLSRPLDVRSGALSHARGDPDDAHAARSDRRRAPPAGGAGRRRGGDQADRR